MSNSCHGCNGKGWVSPTGVNAVLCPVCAGSGVYATKTFTTPPTNPDYVLLPKITCGADGVTYNKPFEFKSFDLGLKPPKPEIKMKHEFKNAGVICRPY